MLLVRTILAALIAISVAVVPVAVEAAVTTTPAKMSMSVDADMPCCPCCNEQDTSKTSATCAFKCINLVGAVCPAMIVIRLHLIEAVPPSFVNDTLRGHVSSPPTHPPPV
jgi:hypothetical protein